MMKCLIIGRNRSATEQMRSFCNEVVLAFDNSFANQRNLPEYEQNTIVYSKTNISHIWGVLPRIKEIIQWQKRYKIDIIYTNTKWDMLAARVASTFIKKKVVLISTSHNSYAWQSKRAVKLMSWLVRNTTDIYVALSSFVYDALCKNGVKKDNVLLIPNTIDSESWECKNVYVTNEKFRIVYVAYVYPAKRQDFILNVLQSLPDQYSVEVDCYGDIDGYPDYVSQIIKDAKAQNLSNKFHLCGRIENVLLRSKLKQYDLYLCSSNLEMSPVNILEAQAAGLPILAANVGGIPDLIQDGVNGLLYESGDIKDAANKIIRLIHDEALRAKLGLGAREFVSHLHTNITAGNQLKSKIKSIINA